MMKKMSWIVWGTAAFLAALPVHAELYKGLSENKPVLLAGEIELAPATERTRSNASAARSQKERAGAYQGRPVTPTPITEDETEEEGVMSPRGGVPAENRAYENRIRAGAYQQGKMPPQEMSLEKLMNGATRESQMNTQERARDSRLKARSYVDTSKDVDLSNVGRDGIPVVPCDKDVSNVSGRIGGDENVSGSLFQIYRNGKPVKVRCQ